MDVILTSDNIIRMSLLLLSCGLFLFLRRYKNDDNDTKYYLLRQTGKFLAQSIAIVIMSSFMADFCRSIHSEVITGAVINIICISLIAITFISKAFLFIDRMESKQVRNGSDITNSKILARGLKIILVIIIVLLYGKHFGMSLSGLLTFGGIGGLAIGMACKDILSNFFSGIVLYFERPFKIGDWICSPDRNIEGTVKEIGWRTTKIITFDMRPLYVPNSLFTSISVENPGRMSNRRIKTTIGLRYEDADKVGDIAEEIRNFLKKHSDIDQGKTILVYFNGFGESSLNIMIYCFTKTKLWEEWLKVQQSIFLAIIDMVKKHHADFAFPSRTLYIESSQPANTDALSRGE
ncbi:MscS family membrane protein [Izhakiella capsodis]|uniref:MscS family membrane protein n=1 Tax=Izhakiella capsodis TaxID=1367852 RepID=A0A1I4VUV2_9GAMM|nr:mechanosensitive ion channel family protein [Izhakiella capsodis]SFN04973.1 MscS family membrane protein [Izhakiella capsodis]